MRGRGERDVLNSLWPSAARQRPSLTHTATSPQPRRVVEAEAVGCQTATTGEWRGINLAELSEVMR